MRAFGSSCRRCISCLRLSCTLPSPAERYCILRIVWALFVDYHELVAEVKRTMDAAFA